MTKILFVCHGNICRSPVAEFVLKDMVKKAGKEKEFFIASAATTTDEIWNGVGNPVYPPARDTLLQHGIDPSGKRATLLTQDDYNRYDFIIGMDRENLHDMHRICGGDPQHKISLLLDYTDHPRDVADPWYTRNFDVAYADIVEGCKAFVEKRLAGRNSK
jgi:protein-tyrosine phosphatase